MLLLVTQIVWAIESSAPTVEKNTVSSTDNKQKDNPHKLPKECQKYFLLAQQHRSDTLGILYSDSMRMEALRLNHSGSYVISFLGPCYYHCSTYNIVMMEESAKQLREAALKYDDKAYYYSSYNVISDAHIERRAFSNAIQIQTALYNESEKFGDQYGMWSSSRRLSEIYDMMGNDLMAQKHLRNAIKLWPRQNKPTSATYLYCRLANLERSREKRLEIINEGEQYAMSYFDSAHVNTSMLRYYAETQDSQNFLTLHNKIKSHPRYPSGYSQIQRVEFNAFEKMFTEGKESATKYLTENYNLIKRDYLSYMRKVNLYSNDYESAIYWHEKEDSVLNSQQAEVLVNDIYAFNSRLFADSIHNAVKTKDMELQLAMQEKAMSEAERARIEAENARLNAERQKAESERLKTLAEAERQKAQVRLMAAEKENDSIRLQQQQQSLKRMEAERKAAQAEAENERATLRTTQLTGVLGILAMLIIAALLYARRQRQTRKHIELLNADLREAQVLAKRAEEMKNVFMQNMSHEIRTPMNAIMGFSQILTMPDMSISEEDKKEYGQHIIENVNMLHMLVEDMLNASDIETGRFEVTLKQEKVEQICKAAMGIARYRVPGNLKYSFKSELPKGFSCATDSKRVQQVLVNYLTNACKHTAKGSIEVGVRLDEARKKVVFSVTDTGSGVPLDKADIIFERFTKVDDFKQGIGLGLNICRSIAKKLNGRTWLDTSYTDGARFCFEIPSDAKETETK